MTVRVAVIGLFFLYGLLIPVFSREFVSNNPTPSLLMVALSSVMAILLWSRRALLFNIVLAFYVFKIYLTLPYIDIFASRLQGDEYNYISGSHAYYNSHDAVVVYLHLLLLLVGWLCGLLIHHPRRVQQNSPPWIFRFTDTIITNSRGSFWVVFITLSFLNFRSATESWQGIAGGESGGLFAYGLCSMETIKFVCLAVFMNSLQSGGRRASVLLLVPAIVSAVISSLGGSRGVIFFMLYFCAIHWLFFNFDKRINRRDILRLIAVILLIPVTIFSGLLAQSLRPLLSAGSPASTVWQATADGLNIFDPANPLINSFFFGATQLLHRLSSLSAQFLILNDHFANDPWEVFNPLQALMRIINDIVPGDVFADIIPISQLFDYIYYNSHVYYSYVNWSIQGTLYLYCGYWASPIITFLFALSIGRYYSKLESLAKSSPAFVSFLILLVSASLEYGTLEQVIPDFIVRALSSYLVIILLAGGLGRLTPSRPLRPFRP